MRPLNYVCVASPLRSPCLLQRLRAVRSTCAQWPTDKKYESDSTFEKTTPFAGYYADLMDAPLRSVQPQTRTSPAPPPPDELPKTEEEARLAKARVIFGSRLAGPVERRTQIERLSQNVAGVMIPPKPEEPDNCCNSGCVNCVWDRFREELEEWAEKSTEARVKLQERRRMEKQTTGTMAKEGDTLNHTAVSMDDDGGGSEANFDTETQPGTDLFADIPVGIREFMKTEKRLKARHKQARTLPG